MKKKYLARNGAPFKVEDAQSIGEFIERNKDIGTKALLEVIKENKKEPIYQYIEWDDDQASYMFRLQQVRNIVNHIEIEIVETKNQEPIRAFYSVQQVDDSKDRVYVSMDTAFSSDYYRKQIIDRAIIEIKNWTARYERYGELTPLIRYIKKYLEEEPVLIEA